MPLLTDLAGEALGPGDILRLPDNYDTGPGSGPVDLLVFDPREDDYGLGLIVASGYKSGLILHLFPKASRGPGERATRGLSVDWLVANWRDWFRYTYHTTVDRPDPIPLEGARVLRWDARTMPEETSR
jgi:hypothetical protein